MDLARITSCRDVAEDDIAEALETRDDTRALLDHLVKIAQPRTGGARLLLVFARMATPACDWLDGALRVEIGGDAEVSVIETFAQIGPSLKERVFPPMAVQVPLEEFVLAVQRFPQAILPLVLARPSPTRVVLAAAESQRVERDQDDAPSRPKERIATPAPLSLADLPTVGGTAAAKRPALAPAGTLANLPTVMGRRDAETSVEPDEEPPISSSPQVPVAPAVAAAATVSIAERPDDVPTPSKGPPSKPLARLQLRRVPAPRGGVVEEVDDRDKKRGAAPLPQVPPPPPLDEPEPPVAENDQPEPPQRRSDDDLDSGWE